MSMTDLLTTIVPVDYVQQKLTYRDHITLVGSCFTEHIGLKLQRYKYHCENNPFGILYNPVSIARCIERIVHLEFYTPDDLVLHDGLYHSMDHHGSFSGKNKDQVVQEINASITRCHAHLKKSSFVFISPGTSNVYRYKPTGQVTGNCHKIPQVSFDHLSLSVDECAASFEKTIASILHIAPQAHIIWTVSPVRHIRDGLVENQRSKAALLLAIDQCIKNHPACAYFPAYEIMMDQLRDYRFYARDLVHPSELAIDIIWDIFCDTYIEPHEREYHRSIEKIKRAMEHRFIHDAPGTIKAFAQNQLRQIDHMASLLPDARWHEERQYFFQLVEED